MVPKGAGQTICRRLPPACTPPRVSSLPSGIAPALTGWGFFYAGSCGEDGWGVTCGVVEKRPHGMKGKVPWGHLFCCAGL